jgi:hypothetical protein
MQLRGVELDIAIFVFSAFCLNEGFEVFKLGQNYNFDLKNAKHG